MKLNVEGWQFFYLKDLCKITMGNKLDWNAMSTDNPKVNFVGRSAENNGVAGQVDKINNISPYKAGCITVALGGSLGASYLQTSDFYTSQNVSVLEFEESISKEAKLFITCLIMNESKYKYFPFGRELNSHIRTDFGFTLPVLHNQNGTPFFDEEKKYSNEGYVPDWQFMEDYIKSLYYKPLTTKNKESNMKLNVEEWKEFRVGELFTQTRGGESAPNQNEDGDTPLITETEENNGFVRKVQAAKVFSKNAITVSINFGQVVFFQSEDFCASVNIAILRNENLNRYNGLFVASILKTENNKYSYGYKTSKDKINNSIVKLPATENGEPDWQFMEDYIKSLPYGDKLSEE